MHRSISMSGNKKTNLASKNRKVPSWYLEANLKAKQFEFLLSSTVHILKITIEFEPAIF